LVFVDIDHFVYPEIYMDLKSGFPYWLLKNELPSSHPSLKKNHSCNVLIIGGGISGVLAAYHLYNAGYQVTVVDRRHFGTGSTCASTALIQYETDEHLSNLIERFGVERATRCYQLTFDAVKGLGAIIKKHKIECEYKKRPSLYLASYVRDRVKVMKEYESRINSGFDLEFWDRRQIESKFGFTASAALWSEFGAELDAFELTNALIKFLSRKGVSFYEGTEIVNVSHVRQKFVATTSTGLKIKAHHVVITGGYESESFLGKKISKLNSTYAVVSEPVAHSQLWYRSCLIWESARPYLYMRTTPDNRIIIGGKDEPFYNPDKRDKLLTTKCKALTTEFEKKFPLIPFTPDFKWTGTFAETNDSLPYIDKRNGLFFVMGFGGNGITYSQMAGPLLVDLIGNHKNPDLGLFTFKR